MAPATTTSFFEPFTPANGSAASVALMSVPSSIPSLHAIVSQHAQTSFPKQFIPFGVLTVFLVLLFLSHLLRYPRILYASQELLGNHPRPICDSPSPNVHGRRSFHGKENDTRAGFFLRPSFVGSKRLSSFDPHTEGIYSEPTVRLVRAYHNYSPEPRVYLPEEIILPSPSLTLVNSSRSDVSISNTDVQPFSPRVYLPPPLPDASEPPFIHTQADSYTGNGSPPKLDLTLRPPSYQSIPGLVTDPFAHPSAGFYDFTSTSSGELALPSMQDQLPSSSVSPNLVLEDFEAESQTSHLTRFPGLSPPPLAHAHPILVRRAISSWCRRSSLGSSYDTFQMNHVTQASVSTPRNRSSVPSRLRYLMTRSVSASFSGSQTHSTPAPSSGRSEEFSTSNRSTSHHDATTLMRPRFAEESGVYLSEGLLDASTRLSELAMTPEIQWQKSNFRDLVPTQANHRQYTLPDNHRLLSVPEDIWMNSQALGGNAGKDVPKIGNLLKKHSSSLISSDIQGETPEYRSSSGLGLSLVSEPRSTELHPCVIPEPAFGLQTSKNAYSFSAESDVNEDSGLDIQNLKANSSLRTVASRWMSLRPASPCPSLAVGLNEIPDDESVEIMVMGRSEGLEGV